MCRGRDQREVNVDSKANQPFLAVLGGSCHGLMVPIDGPTIILGRDENGDVVVDDPTVSRKHAEILPADGGCRLRDLGSKNGTFVNRRNIRAAEHRLNDGDEIRLGSSHVAVVFRDFSKSLRGVNSRKPDSDRRTVGGLLGVARADEDNRTTESVIRARYGPVGAGVPEIPGGFSQDEVYGGTIRLKVVAEDNSPYLRRWVEELRRRPQLGLLQVVSNTQRDADILLAIWEPLPLMQTLAEMEGVSQVSQIEHDPGVDSLGEDLGRTEGRERVVMVRLSAEPRWS